MRYPGRVHTRLSVHRAWRLAILASVAFHAWLAAAPAYADAQDHDIRLPAQDQAITGEPRSLSLTIAPLPGHTISREGPLMVDLDTAPDSGLHLPRRRYQRRDAADARAEAPRFDLRYRADAPGRHALRVDLRFWACARRTCRPVHVTRTVTIEASAPPAPPAPAGE